MAAAPECWALGSSGKCPTLHKWFCYRFSRHRQAERLRHTVMSASTGRIRPSDRAQRDRALMDNGEEDADSGIDSGILGFDAVNPHVSDPARRYQKIADPRTTAYPSPDFQQSNLQQREQSPHQPNSDRDRHPAMNAVNGSEQAQRPRMTSPSQQTDPSEIQKSGSSGFDAARREAAADSSQADAWGDWGPSGSNIGSEPQQHIPTAGNSFAWATSDRSRPQNSNRSPADEERRSQGDENGTGRSDSEARSEEYQDADGARGFADITPLTPLEQEDMVRLAPSGEQAAYFNSTSLAFVQQCVGASIVTLLAASKFVWLAAGSLTFPFWWPWAQATLKNQALLSKFRYQGLWRARVVEVELQGTRKPQFTGAGRGERQPMRPRFDPLLRMIIGDDSGARSEIIVPFQKGYGDIRVGDSVELLVVSTKENFDDFVAVQEAYLPATSTWLAKYPFLNRDAFLDLSLAIERQRTTIQSIDITPGVETGARFMD